MSDYRKIDRDTQILKGVRYLRKLPEEASGKYKSIISQLKRGKNVGSSHSRVIIPKSSFESIKEDFKRSRHWLGSIPEKGAVTSWRGPNNLHAHEYKKWVVVHRDRTEPKGAIRALKHFATEGLPSIPKLLAGKKLVKEASVMDGVLFELTKSAGFIENIYSPTIPLTGGRATLRKSEEDDPVSSGLKATGRALYFPVATGALVTGGGVGALLAGEALSGKAEKELSEALIEKYLPGIERESADLWRSFIPGAGQGPAMAMTAEGDPGKIFHSKSTSVTAHEIGHGLDKEHYLRTRAVKGDLPKYFAKLQGEYRASRKAFDILKKEIGLFKAIRSVPGLTGAFASHALNMPTPILAATVGVPLGIATAIGVKKYIEEDEA